MLPEIGKRTGDGSPIDVTKELALLEGTLKCRYFAHPEETGEAIGYHKNGRLRFRYPLYKGSMHGMGTVWDEEGNLLREEEFRYGVRHGKNRMWYPGGVLKSECRYVRGRRSGERREWYETGLLRFRYEYLHDTIRSLELLHGGCIKYYPNGKIESQVTYDFGVMHGVYRSWDTAGKLTDKYIYVRGVRVSGELHSHILNGTLTAKKILGITNAAVRHICLEELGYGRFLSQVPHEIIDRSGESELVKIDWHKREEPMYLVKVKCPSTGAFYTLRVPPAATTVKAAVAWTFGVSAEEYDPEAEA